MTTNNIEERADTRFESQFTIFIERVSSSVDNSSPANVIVCNSLDLSAKGLQVVVDESIEIETILRLCLDIKDRDPIFVVGEVKWQRPDTETDGVRIGFLLFESDDTDIDAWKQAIEELASKRQLDTLGFL